MNRLMIGPGQLRREGWKTLDADPNRGWDFVATIPPLPAAVKAIPWDEIEWIHGITSLYPWDGEQAVIEIFQVLAPGGRLTLEQPDFRQARARLEWVFGDAAEFKNPLLMNRWGYTPDSLTELLQRAGFAQIDILPARHHKPSRDFRVEAFKA